MLDADLLFSLKPRSESDDNKFFKDRISEAYSATYGKWFEGFFWNYGLYDEKLENEIKGLLPGWPYKDYYSELLYYYAINNIVILIDHTQQLRLLEVGCSWGGGLNFISRIFKFYVMHGIDISDDSINTANALYSRPPYLKFSLGDAENMPFNDNSFDIVLNVESAHHYSDLEKFISEVERVLSSGGWFCLADIFTAERYRRLTNILKTSTKLKLVRYDNISKQVKEAINKRINNVSSQFNQIIRGKSKIFNFDEIKARELWNGMYGAGFLDNHKMPLQEKKKRLENKTMPDNFSYFLLQKL